MNIDTREITLEPADNARLLALCGPFDDNIKQLERRLGIEINRRDNHFKLTGRALCVHAAADILRSLYVDTAPMRGQIQDIEPEQIHLAIKEARVLEQSAESVPEYGKAVNIKTKRGVIKPRTPNQAQYIANILDHDITFGVGPAGTGKTYLAVAAAVDALERQEIRRILLTRPAVEAGEKLGFLPGDLAEKVNPYLRPLHDALLDMLGPQKMASLQETGIIEVAPLAFMRGRTLNDAFIILDEAQIAFGVEVVADKARKRERENGEGDHVNAPLAHRVVHGHLHERHAVERGGRLGVLHVEHEHHHGRAGANEQCVDVDRKTLDQALLNRVRNACSSRGVRSGAHAGFVGVQATLDAEHNDRASKTTEDRLEIERRREHKAEHRGELADIAHGSPHSNRDVNERHNGNNDRGDDADALRAAKDDDGGDPYDC